MKIIRDGDHYLVAADNFINLQESSDYFFITEAEYFSTVNSLPVSLAINNQTRPPSTKENQAHE